MMVCTVCGIPPDCPEGRVSQLGPRGFGWDSSQNHSSVFLMCRCRLLWTRLQGSVIFGSSGLRFSLSSHFDDPSAVLTDWFRVEDSFPQCDEEVAEAIGLVVAASVMDQ